MYGVGLVAPLALLPQILQIYTTKSAAGLSVPTWFLLIIHNVLWSLYAVVHKEPQLMLANSLFALFNTTIFVGILLY